MAVRDGARRYGGLITATFTPMREDGGLDLDKIAPMADHLIAQGIRGFYVCGSTGEGVSLTVEERQEVAAAFVAASRGRVPVIVQVGHESLRQAQGLAAHAQAIGADAISAVPPTYFRPSDPKVVVECAQAVAAAAPELDFFYYHIPVITRVELDLVPFVEAALDAIPTFAGVKFSDTRTYQLQLCIDRFGDAITMLFGVDEMLLGGLVAGAHGAVGSTYNFLTEESLAIVDAFAHQRLAEAQVLQLHTASIIAELNAIGGLAALKAAMGAVVLDCGTTRLPLTPLSKQATERVRQAVQRRSAARA